MNCQCLFTIHTQCITTSVYIPTLLCSSMSEALVILFLVLVISTFKFFPNIAFFKRSNFNNYAEIGRFILMYIIN